MVRPVFGVGRLVASGPRAKSLNFRCRGASRYPATNSIPNRRIAHVPLQHPTVIGYWRSVGHSTNDFFYESFFDEIADAGGHDPYELRLQLLADKPRQKTLLEAVGALWGGWKRGPFGVADGSRRARGVAMASPFRSEVATIGEVSLNGGTVVVHEIWVAIDPRRIVNPAIIESQVKSAVALGLWSALLEEVVFIDGQPQARNFDCYSILPPNLMPRVHVQVIESGAALGGVGESGLPRVPPAVANAVAALTGQRVRTLPLEDTIPGHRLREQVVHLAQIQSAPRCRFALFLTRYVRVRARRGNRLHCLITGPHNMMSFPDFSSAEKMVSPEARKISCPRATRRPHGTVIFSERK
jgi:Molybdopterin-binding domain of aldehyde dehydrogenase